MTRVVRRVMPELNIAARFAGHNAHFDGRRTCTEPALMFQTRNGIGALGVCGPQEPLWRLCLSSAARPTLHNLGYDRPRRAGASEIRTPRRAAGSQFRSTMSPVTDVKAADCPYQGNAVKFSRRVG